MLIYSNSLIEAIKAKLKYGYMVRIHYLPRAKRKSGDPHFYWIDKMTDNVKYFAGADSRIVGLGVIATEPALRDGQFHRFIK